MRCLRPEPDARPASALAVAASLPGGDPLAAALAAGETPSPAMVAAAGMTDAMSSRHTMMAAAWMAVSLVVVLLMYQRVLLVNRVPIPKPADALADRAQEALAKLGYSGTPRAAASGMTCLRPTTSGYVDATSTARDRWKNLATLRPESVVFWYRTSPRPLIPWGRDRDVEGTNPPLNVSGMTLSVFDASGRLSEFHAIPEPIDSGAPHAPTRLVGAVRSGRARHEQLHPGGAAMDPARLRRRARGVGGPSRRSTGPDLPGRGGGLSRPRRCSSGSPARGRTPPAPAPVAPSRFNAAIEWLAEPDHAGPDACRRSARAPQRPASARRPRGRVPRRLHPVRHEPDGLGARHRRMSPTSASRSTGCFRP